MRETPRYVPERHTNIFEGHTKRLERHTKILKRHSELFEGHTQILERYTNIFEGNTKILQGGGGLEEQGYNAKYLSDTPTSTDAELFEEHANQGLFIDHQRGKGGDKR